MSEIAAVEIVRLNALEKEEYIGYRNVQSDKERERMYFSKAWERSADYLGGIDRNNYNDFWNYRNFVPW